MNALQHARTLNDGVELPMFGVGLYKVQPRDVEALVNGAWELGYRLFDTAAMYENESALGAALRETGMPRDEIFVTTKVLNADHGFARTRDAFERSREALGLEVIDLYLIHWPAPRQNRFLETWEALVSLRDEGVVRSIGVSNFHPHHLDALARVSEVVPSVNQVECHPWLPQNALRRFHVERGIATQAWSPLARGRILDDSTLGDIGRAHGVEPAEVALAWQLQRVVAVIPKTTSVRRLATNARAAEITLSDDEMRRIAALETGERTGADPDERD